jgi:hypothetical protein
MIHLGDNAPIDNNFLDENLFAISTFTTWSVDVANYLLEGLHLGVILSLM